jgi:hypothetical protein
MTARREFTAEEFARAGEKKRGPKKRKNGTLPYPPEEDDVEQIRDWLTLAFRPRSGWRVLDFERPVADDLGQHCHLICVNGNEHRRYRFPAQRDLTAPTKLRTTVAAITAGELRMPHLTTVEAGDVWEALCRIGRVLSERGEGEQAHEWLDKLLEAARPLEGHTLRAGADRRDALMALQRWGEFTHLDARAVLKDPDSPWPRRPVCLIDRDSGDYWLRHREAMTFLRYILDVKPLRDTTLMARWKEIGVERRDFEEGSHRPPHLRAKLYRVSREVVLHEP